MNRLALITLLLCTSILLSCDQPDANSLAKDASNRLTIIVRATEIDKEITELRSKISLNNREASIGLINHDSGLKDRIFQNRGKTEDKFAFELPSGSRGLLHIAFDAITSDLFISHSASVDLQVTEDKVYIVELTLRRNELCTGSGWCWEQPRPTATHFKDIWGTGPDDLWVVGDGGIVLHFDGFGYSQVPLIDEKVGTQEAVFNPYFAGVHGTNSSDVWAISGARGGRKMNFGIWKFNPDTKALHAVYRKPDDGTGRSDYLSIFVSDNTLWLGGNRYDKKTLERTQLVTDTKWELRRIFDRDPGTATDLWAVGDYYDSAYKPFLWHWDGSSWISQAVTDQATLPEALHHVIAGPSGIWVSSINGLFFRQTNAQGSLSVVSGRNPGLVLDSLPNGDEIYLSGDAREYYWAGKPREIVHKDQSGKEERIHFSDYLTAWRSFSTGSEQDRMIHIVGKGGFIKKYRPSTKELSTVIAGASKMTGDLGTLRDVYGSSEKDVWAVGDAGRILHYDGQAWQEIASPTTKTLHRCWLAGPGDFWAVGDAGTIVHWNAVTSNIDLIPSGISANLYSVWGTGPQDVYFVGDDSTIARWDGTLKRDTNPGETGHYRAVWAPPSGSELWLGGHSLDGNNFILWKRSAGTWKHIEPPNAKPTLLNIRGSSSSNVVVSASETSKDNGHAIFRYDGSAWQALFSDSAMALVAFSSSQIYGTTDEDALLKAVNPIYSAYDLRDIGASQQYYGLWGPSPDNLWLVGTAGSILHYRGKAF